MHKKWWCLEGGGEEFGGVPSLAPGEEDKREEQVRRRRKRPTFSSFPSFLHNFLSSRRRALEVCNQVRAVLGLLEPGEDHLGAYGEVFGKERKKRGGEHRERGPKQ